MATASIPIVSCLLLSMASFNFVPTPSVPETNTGAFILSWDKSKVAPNPPNPPSTSLRIVR